MLRYYSRGLVTVTRTFDLPYLLSGGSHRVSVRRIARVLES